MLNKMCEEALSIILKAYDGNDSLTVSGSYNLFPEYMRFSHKEIFDKLKFAGFVASYLQSLGGWSVYLAPDAVTYFRDKEGNVETEYNRKQMHSIVGTTNIFYGDTKNVQIQQNTNQSSQNISIEQYFDFDKAVEIFEAVANNREKLGISSPEEEMLVKMVNEAMPKAKARTDSGFVEKALSVVRDTLVGVTANLISGGILYMIMQMGI